MIGMPHTVCMVQRVRTRDGRQLHVEHDGSSSPVVVFEAGMGVSHHMWGAVTPLLADGTATVLYDRSGLGTSPTDPSPRGLDRLVDDHLDVLRDSGDAPFVLVGHSWGGPIVRCAAARVPDRIAGLVLVDQTDEGCDLFFEPANEKRSTGFARMVPILGRTGMGRLIARRQARHLPEPAASGMRREDGTLAALRTQAAELVGSIDDLRRLRDHPVALPDVPVTVISGEIETRMERGRRGGLIEAHRRTAASVPRGRHVLATRSGHLVPFTEPELVAAEIDRVVELARG